MRYVYKFKLCVLAGAVMALSACSDKSGDISILSDSDTFYQSTSVNNKIDIMWVVDDSGSMSDNQTNLSSNFNAFINDFVTKGYDYHMAVIGTGAYTYNYTAYNNETGSGGTSAGCIGGTTSNQNVIRFRDGNIYTGTTSDNTGVRVITSLMNNAIDLFKVNVKVGTDGSGCERGFQSLRAALNSPLNSGYNFRRNDAFFAVILIGDENDTSKKDDGSNYANDNAYSAAFTQFLDNYTNSQAGNRRYTISTITHLDTTNKCANGTASHTVGCRFINVTNAVNGIVGDITDTNFSSSLSQIAEQIVELSTRFRLSREPIVSSIDVKVNGVSIPQNPTNGWTYETEAGFYFIVFHGSAVPAQGSIIQVDFDPVSLE
jgi:hypothetical protein